jgi:predicted ATP-dependent endonuclease of OLD family
MYINRIVLRDVRGFNMDILLRNDWTQEPLKSVLFTGINGSGRTTVLTVIATLWEYFRYWMRRDGLDYILRFTRTGIFADVEFAAIEIHALLDRPLWLFVSRDKEQLDAIKSNTGEAFFIGEIYVNPANIDDSVYENFRAKSIPNAQVIEELDLRLQKLELGVSEVTKTPNMIFIEAERNIARSTNQNNEPHAEPLYSWLVNYGSRRRSPTNIERMLQNTKIRDPELFYTILNRINQFFVGKRLTDFDNNLRLRVQVGEKSHTIHQLSSGEKQCLIMMFMVSRWMMDDGIVLIDEPDLHLHVSLQRHFIHELEKLVLSKNGQLIVASHSPELWEEYNQQQRINLTVGVEHG